MSDDRARWQRLSDLFERALDLGPQARDALLDAECANDPALRSELERMLALDALPHAFDDGAAEAASLPDTDSSLIHQEDPDAIGSHIGPWLLEGVLGRGGMGTVYAARRDDGDTGQRVALKRLHRRWDGSLQAQRFLQERRILAALSHPNIPGLIDHGLDADRRPWFALELVQGQSLIQWADEHKLDLRARLDLFRQVCAAVQHAHEHFVVHRDLKPDNILVDAEGHPKVLDFGVAKRTDDAAGATRTGMFVGFTPAYAAPEQVSGGSISAATDVYALGVILYQLLAGNLPYTFDQDDLHATAEAITGHAAARLDQAITTGTDEEVRARLAQRATDERGFRRFVKGDLSRIVQTALAKEPSRRYASVLAFSSDLERFLEGRTVSVSGDTFAYRARKYIGRNRWGVAMAGVAVLALIGGAAGMAWQVHEANLQRDRALSEAARNAAVREFVTLMFREASDSGDAETLTAREVLKKGAEEIFARYQDEPETVIMLAGAVAELYTNVGDVAGAKPLYEEILKSPHVARFPGQRASAQRNLGTLEFYSGNQARARELLDAAQAFWQTDPARYHLDILDGLSLQAQVERGEEKMDQAIDTMQRLLRDRRALAGGKPNRDVAVASGNLSLAFLQAGRLAEAKAAASESWETYRQLGLERTADALGALNNLANAMGRLGDFAGAEPLARQVYETRRELFPASIETAAARYVLAWTMFEQGRPAEALPHFEGAQAMMVQLTGPDSRMSLQFQPSVAETYIALGRAAEGRAMIEDNLRLASKRFGEQDPIVASSFRVRGLARLAQHDLVGARQDLEAAAAIYRAKGPSRKPELERMQKFFERLAEAEAK